MLAPSFSNPLVSRRGAGYPSQCRRLRPDGFTSPPGTLGWDLPSSHLTLNERVWENHCRNEGVVILLCLQHLERGSSFSTSPSPAHHRGKGIW